MQESDIESLKVELGNLQKLHTDLEKQMMKFDEIIPFERQTTAMIFSPRLLNMMLACGPQIESMTKLIAKRCNIDAFDIVDDAGTKWSKSVPKLIQEINSKAVLAKFRIVSKPHLLLFTPFTLHLEWWQDYNNLKHGLSTNQFKINYTVVMNALAALSALHCIADKLMGYSDDDIPQVLDAKNWVNDEYFIKIANLDKTSTVNHSWESLLFQVDAFYKPF
ncbi:hypothetical protein [Candidatus Nitrosotenuis uzonensis]|uniref:Uncharacterized protein n=1 Tax=Candidatus Nitrosotenuis uzonensis TaxID=1407055 RepID=V6AQT7_9ARCH|nr:hypothetical protein [Candidatus Nitrosotenuis uzonensis]CDI04944.1 hypothetical protein NITUZ_140019 [Candidatus Nitrosotenuis uzonensis]